MTKKHQKWEAEMKRILKCGMRLIISLMLVMALGIGVPMVAAEPENELSVDRAEFNKEWQATYKELQAIDPNAAKEFMELTKQEFAAGTVKYAPTERPAETQTATQTTTQTTTETTERTRTTEGQAQGTRADRPGLGGPEGRSPYAARGVMVPGAHGLSIEDQTKFLKDKGLSEEKVKAVIEIQKGFLEEAAKINPANLTPEKARQMEQQFIDRFQAETGFSAGELFGSPGGPRVGGPDGEFYGPRIEGQIYGAGRTPTSYGPRMEAITLEEKGYSQEDISKIRQAEDEIGKAAANINWSGLTREEAQAKELELQDKFKEISGQDAGEVFGMGGERPVFTDRPLHMEPEGYRPPVGEVWDGTGPMPRAFDPYAPGPDGTYGPVAPYGGPEGTYVGPYEGPMAGPYEGPVGPYGGPEGTYGGTYGGPEGTYGPVAPYGGPEGTYGGPYGGPEGTYGGPYEGPMAGPYEGPAGGGFYEAAPGGGFEGPPTGGYYEAPGGFEGPMYEGPTGGPAPEFDAPMFEGPTGGPAPEFDAPMFDGPMMDGPMPEFDAPMFEGPMMEGPMVEFDVPMFEGPMPEGGPEIEIPVYEFEAPPIDDNPPPEGEPYP